MAKRWPRPASLSLQISVTVPSSPAQAHDEFGWLVWSGQINAKWEADKHDWRQFDGFDDARLVDEDECVVTLRIGRCERWLLSLEAAEGRMSRWELIEAADEVSQNLSDTVCPLAGSQYTLVDQAYGLSRGGDIDRLLVLSEIELIPQMRGQRIGAWASARTIDLIVGDDDMTLIVALAAPLDRREFMRDRAESESGELAPEEMQQWVSAQRRIRKYWRQRMGLVSLKGSPNILIGTGSSTAAARKRARVWPHHR